MDYCLNNLCFIYIDKMSSQFFSQPERLEIRASERMNRFGLGLYLVCLIGIPWIGWIGFGPGAAGDTAVNGNSVWAFWAFHFCLLGFWVACLIGIRRSLNLLKDLPILFVLDKVGVTDRGGIKTPWREFESAYYVSKAWNLYLDVRPRTQYKNIVIKGEEIGFKAIDEVKLFMILHAPSELTGSL